MDTVTVREVAESIRSADEWRRRAEVEVILGICRLAEGYSVDRDELVEALVERQIRLGGDGTPLVSEFVSLELAGLLRCSPTVAGNRIVEALDLKHRHPGLLAAVEAFEIEPSWALRAARRCHQLSIELADRVTDRWLTRIRGLGWTAAFNLLERLIVSTDAELAAERERRARESRGVYVWGLDDGVMNLTGRLDATDARWFDDALSQVAAVLEAEHPGLTAEQRRAKAVGVLAHPALALALLQRAAQPLLPLDGKPGAAPVEPCAGGRVPGHLCGSVGVPLAKLRPRARLIVHLHCDSVGSLPGSARIERAGEITTALLAELLGDVHVTVRPVIDLPSLPTDDRYVPRAGIRRAVLLAMEREMFPYSNRRAAGLDLDHTVAYRPGRRGQTGLGNLAPLGRRGHRAKTMGAWRVEQPKPACLIWMSPLKYRYEVSPSGTFMLR